MSNYRLVLPPLRNRKKVLNRYYEDLKTMDYIDALVRYQNTMQIMYARYNLGIKIKLITREFYEKTFKY